MCLRCIRNAFEKKTDVPTRTRGGGLCFFVLSLITQRRQHSTPSVTHHQQPRKIIWSHQTTSMTATIKIKRHGLLPFPHCGTCFFLLLQFPSQPPRWFFPLGPTAVSVLHTACTIVRLRIPLPAVEEAVLCCNACTRQ